MVELERVALTSQLRKPEDRDAAMISRDQEHFNFQGSLPISKVFGGASDVFDIATRR